MPDVQRTTCGPSMGTEGSDNSQLLSGFLQARFTGFLSEEITASQERVNGVLIPKFKLSDTRPVTDSSAFQELEHPELDNSPAALVCLV